MRVAVSFSAPPTAEAFSAVCRGLGRAFPNAVVAELSGLQVTIDTDRTKAAPATLEQSRRRRREVPPGTEQVLYSVRQVAESLNLSKGTIYLATQSGKLDHIKYGRRILVPKEALEAFVAENASASKQ
jgi:excisionase family DNA binding protein